MTDAEVEAVRDASELQRLLKAQLALNRNPAAVSGGRSGVLWKGVPPSLDESEDYGVLKKKLKVWQMATGLDDKGQAAALIQGIMDDHKHHKKGLLSLLMGTLSDAVSGPADRGRGHGDKSAKELTCWTCGKPGHRAAKCIETKLFDEMENEEGHYTGECWMTEQEPDNLHELIEIDELEELIDCEEEDGEQDCHVDVNATETRSFRAEAEAAAGLDSCCSRTIMGKGWLSEYKKVAPYYMKKDIKGPEPSYVTFTFGNGGKMHSSGRYLLPVMIHGKLIRLAVELVSSDIPLLLSKSTMQKCGIVLDFS